MEHHYYCKNFGFTLAEVFHPASKSRKTAFTLAEVLITLGIIGIVAVLVLPSLITKINNKGYTEKFLKAYSSLQNVTNKVVEEEGLPASWTFTDYHTANDIKYNDHIFDSFAKHFNTIKICYDRPYSARFSQCVGYWYAADSKIKTLNGEEGYTMLNGSGYGMLAFNSLILQDGTLINFFFYSSDIGFYWAAPASLSFTIDVNGKKGPNKIGRDIFFLYLTNEGKILPTYANSDTCETDKSGHSCAYRIITEGKMNY